jgi:hypothetical protein
MSANIKFNKSSTKDKKYNNKRNSQKSIRNKGIVIGKRVMDKRLFHLNDWNTEQFRNNIKICQRTEKEYK